MVLITGEGVYSRLMQANPWVGSFLPNAFMNSGGLSSKPQELSPALQSLFERPLRGVLVDRLEAWEMNRKIARFTRQHGYGDETIFNAEVCQGNFDHHRSWTYEALEKRLQQYVIASDGRVAAERHTLAPGASTGVETERSNLLLKEGIASSLGFDTAENHRLLNQRGAQ